MVRNSLGFTVVSNADLLERERKRKREEGQIEKGDRKRSVFETNLQSLAKRKPRKRKTKRHVMMVPF